MPKIFKSILALIAVAMLLPSCGKDDPIIPNEEELITTLSYTLTPTSGGSPVVLSFTDLDGDGGNSPTIVGGSLQANATYNGEIQLLNESASPVENITAEIMEEAVDHQFFFQSDIENLAIAYRDIDSNRNPIGLSTSLSTGQAGTGSITVILRHEPNKGATGVSTGDIANAGGETDIQVTFPISVQ